MVDTSMHHVRKIEYERVQKEGFCVMRIRIYTETSGDYREHTLTLFAEKNDMSTLTLIEAKKNFDNFVEQEEVAKSYHRP